MNYIGVDCHISSLDFAVVNERGTTTKRQRVNTGVKELIGFIKSVPCWKTASDMFTKLTNSHECSKDHL